MSPGSPTKVPEREDQKKPEHKAEKACPGWELLCSADRDQLIGQRHASAQGY